MALIQDTSPVSEELLRTRQWIQDIRSGLTTSPQMRGFSPNSNNTAVNVTHQRDGCSREYDDNSGAGSKDTDVILESMKNVGGMNYAKYRLKTSRTKAFGKHKKVRSPTLPWLKKMRSLQGSCKIFFQGLAR